MLLFKHSCCNITVQHKHITHNESSVHDILSIIVVYVVVHNCVVLFHMNFQFQFVFQIIIHCSLQVLHDSLCSFNMLYFDINKVLT